MTPAGPAPRASPRGAPSGPLGFTLIELLVVTALLGVMLLLVPPNLEGFGDRSRLVSAGNVMASALTAAREMAIIDGHETRMQYDLPGDLKDREKTGRFRYVLTTRVKTTPRGLEEDGIAPEPRAPPPEEEWTFTEWRPFPAGVILSAFSEKSGEWVRANPRGEPIEVSFLADGTVRPAHALRLVSVDLGAGAQRVLTVRVNALTSAAEVIEGEAELPRSRDPTEFR